MESSAKTATQLAEELYALMPHAVSTDTLREYGIEASDEQVRQLTLETLYLSLFWIESALNTLLTQGGCVRVAAELRRILCTAWISELRLRGRDLDTYPAELEERRRVYARIAGKGGSPVAVFSAAASLMEMKKIVPAEDRMKALAVFIDLIPVDAFGDVLEGVDLADG